jgi:hypothetical protein
MSNAGPDGENGPQDTARPTASEEAQADDEPPRQDGSPAGHHVHGLLLYPLPYADSPASARVRIVEQDEYVPIRSLVALNRHRFNDPQARYLHYSEAMALTVFLMDHDHGRYREPFLEYVADAYRGRIRGGSSRSLSSRLELSYSELDQQFRAFLERAEVY